MLTLEVRQLGHTYNHDLLGKEFGQWFLTAEDPSLSIAYVKVKGKLCSLPGLISNMSLSSACTPNGDLYAHTALAFAQRISQTSKLCRRTS